MPRVVGWIDIEAPCQVVFDTIADVERRMQLSPLWGLSQLLEVSADFPRTGSSYRVRVLPDAPFGIAGGMSNTVQNAFAGLAQMITWKAGHREASPEPEAAPDEPSTAPADLAGAEQCYVVAECESPNRLSYRLDAAWKTTVSWRLQSIPRGTRVNYEEVFGEVDTGGEEFVSTVQRIVNDWLHNIKRYAELRGSRWRSFVKWTLDRFYLKLRPDQRRAVLLIVSLQGIGLVTFVVAAMALGVAFFLS